MRVKDKRERTSRAGEMLDPVGLGTLKEKYAHELSGGQQRVALARAPAIQPRVLLGEPPSALDAKVRAQ